MKITLLRHGRPAVELKGRIRAHALQQLATAYDGAGISDQPSDHTIELAEHHNIVVCSDLPRALHSAQALGLTNMHHGDALFRETAIPHFDRGSLKLPVGVWIVLLRMLWLMGFSKNGESFSGAKGRAREAADELIRLAKEHESVLLVGHGFINYFIARELLARHWSGPSRPGRRYWQHATYHYQTAS